MPESFLTLLIVHGVSRLSYEVLEQRGATWCAPRVTGLR
ncbi:hypothetical protein L810_5457 [Burkholderia sp. AU4i]|nr:hypothetical protein L810_5457 [Burkholderia sp. AU4i]MDW9233872.1 aminotransferase class-III domain protein [Burkholderia cepacia]QOH35846.1 aminotransferase class-III domain protein [Burkholderia cepacia]